MKKIFFVLALILLINSVQALNFNVKEQIPANTAFSFNITFDSFDFSEAKVYLNEEQLLSVFTYAGNKTIIEEYSNKVVASKMDSLTLTAIISSLEAGSYQLKVALYKGSLTGQETITFNVFNVLPESFKTETENNLANIQENFSNQLNELSNEMNSNFNEVNEKTNLLENNLNSTNNSLQETQQDLNNANENINALENQLNDLKKENSSLKEEVSLLQNKLALAQQELEQQALKLSGKATGFASLAGVNPAIALLLLAVVVFVAILLFVFNKHFRSELTLSEKDISTKGKFALKEEPPKVNFSDLIRKSH